MHLPIWRECRESLEASTSRMLEKGKDVEEEESVGRAVATLQDLFKRARRLEGQADGEALLCLGATRSGCRPRVFSEFSP